MFGNASLPSRIFSYAAQPPRTEAERVREQMYLAHRYRNKLCESELQRRMESEAVLARLATGLAPLVRQVEIFETAITSATDLINAPHARERKREAGRAHAEPLQAARRRLREARAALKAARAEAWQRPDVRAELDKIEADHAERNRRYRAECGVHWGSYLVVEQGCAKFRKGAPPRFHRFDGSGHLAVQIQKGMTWEEALSGLDSRLRVAIYSPEREASGKRAAFRQASQPGSKRSQRRLHLLVSLRIGSEGSKPIFADVPIVLHRPLPPDSRIKWVHLLRRRVGPDDRWAVQFVVSREEGFEREDQAAGGHVGIDLGWRLTERGLRVAVWSGSDGTDGEVVIPAADLERWDKAEKLQGTRDQNFNSARSLLADWLSERNGSTPDWLREQTSHLHAWRSPERLTALVWHWRGREQRFDGDEEIFATLEAWRKHERHLHRYQAGVLRQAQEFREHLYRNAVVDLRRRYHTAHIEDTDWRQMARREQVEEDKVFASYQRRLAAPGRFAELLHEHMAEVVEWPAEYTTQRCHVSGKRERFDAQKEIVHCCECGCGTEWDQDVNAARILLAYAEGRLQPLPRERQGV